MSKILSYHRKDAQAAASLLPEHAGPGAALGHLRLPYDALFELSLSSIDFSTTIAGHRLDFPLIFASMTGGTEESGRFNRSLRQIAEDFGLGMGLGSMRPFLEMPELLPTYGQAKPKLLFANLGMSQILRGDYSASVVAKAIEALGANGLYIHFNFLQEFLQTEGDRLEAGSLECLESFIRTLPCPVILKEVGSGLGGRCAQRLASLPVAGLETASRGGSSWVRIEASRCAMADSQLAEALDALGYDLPEAVRGCRRAMGTRSVIASGGLYRAVDLIKALSLGADACAMARRLYGVYREGGEAGLRSFVEDLLTVAKRVWQSCAAPNLKCLQRIHADSDALVEG